MFTPFPLTAFGYIAWGMGHGAWGRWRRAQSSGLRDEE